MIADPDHEVAHFDTFRAQFRRFGGARPARDRRGQCLPHGLEVSDGSDLCLALRGRGSFTQNAPDQRQILRADFRGRRQIREGGGGLAERCAVLVSPGSFKIIGIVSGLSLVESDDPFDSVLIAIRFHQHRARRKDKPVRRERHVIGHFARREQIFVEQSRRHVERLAGVVEACLVRGVHRKFPGGPEVHTGKIANGVVVFRIAQPVRRHRAGITETPAKFIRTDRLNPVGYQAAALGRRLGQGIGRHLLAPDPVHQQGPVRKILHHGGESRKRLKVQLSGRRRAAVA